MDPVLIGEILSGLMLVFLVAALPFIAIVAVVVIAVKIIRKRRK